MSVPKRYLKGLDKEGRRAMKREIAKFKDRPSSDPESYEDWEADKGVSPSRESKYTKRYKSMFGESGSLFRAALERAKRNKAEAPKRAKMFAEKFVEMVKKAGGPSRLRVWQRSGVGTRVYWPGDMGFMVVGSDGTVSNFDRGRESFDPRMLYPKWRKALKTAQDQYNRWLNAYFDAETFDEAVKDAERTWKITHRDLLGGGMKLTEIATGRSVTLRSPEAAKVRAEIRRLARKTSGSDLDSKVDDLLEPYFLVISESSVDTALQNKADETGFPLAILRQVYDRGLAAWRTGHRPGVKQHQWAMARVNSFVTGGKTSRTADKKLYQRAKSQMEGLARTPLTLLERRWVSVEIKKSPDPDKKHVAVFKDEQGRTKTTHFGATGYEDYTTHHDDARKANYLSRHGGGNQDWSDPTTAGALSRYILWNKKSKAASIADFKKRFDL